MLTEKVVQHVVDSLREAYSERGWSARELESLERLIRRRAEQIGQLINQVQGWADADEVDYDVLCTLLGHLPSVHLYFENPFMMQMVNLREHVSWVTEDPGAATDKAFHMVRAAVRRVRLHEPLEHREIEVNTDALVVGAGPAGLKAALILAEAGRKVVLVEKDRKSVV